jgi:hypothetical protein
MSFQIQQFLVLKLFQSVAICTIVYVLGASRIVYIAQIQEVEQVHLINIKEELWCSFTELL